MPASRLPPETMLKSKGHAAPRAIPTWSATCGLGVVWTWAAAEGRVWIRGPPLPEATLMSVDQVITKGSTDAWVWANT